MDVSWLDFKHEGRPIVRVWPEWCSTGLWNPPFLDSEAVGPNLGFDDLPEDFAAKLAAWQDLHDAQRPEAFPDEVWDTLTAEGINLAITLSSLLGASAWVQCEVGRLAPTFLSGRCVAAPAMQPVTYDAGAYAYA